MGLVEDSSTRSLIDTSALHSHKSVFNDIDDADSVLSALFIKGKKDICGLHLLSVQCNRLSFYKVDGYIFRNIRGVNWADSHFQEALLLVLGFISRVLKVQAFVGKVPDILVL